MLRFGHVFVMLGAVACSTRGVHPADDIIVRNAAAAGAGSLADALAQAASSPAPRAVIVPPSVRTIRIVESLRYDGPQPLRIRGGNVVIDASSCGCDALDLTSYQGVELEGLTIRDAAGRGVLVRVPPGARGSFTAVFRDVTVIGPGLHGIHVADQAAGVPAGSDSDAGIRLELRDVRIERTGFRADTSDFDGVRVDEGGAGDITAFVQNTIVRGNAGDGIELDERGTGDVTLFAVDSEFAENGSQPQRPDDLEDGIDVDEADDGSVVVTLRDIRAPGNWDSDIDLDEAGPGDLIVLRTRVQAGGRAATPVSLTELDAGELRDHALDRERR